MFVVTGNRLLDGIVVYLADGGLWVEDIQQAAVLETKEAADASLPGAGEDIVSLDVIPVERDEQAGLRPARLRERIRAAGPTINPFASIDLSRRFPEANH